MRSALFAIGCCLAVGACSSDPGQAVLASARFGGTPFVSGMSPQSGWSRNSEPEPVNSLPPGAGGIGDSGPNSRLPNYGSVTIPTPY